MVGLASSIFGVFFIYPFYFFYPLSLIYFRGDGEKGLVRTERNGTEQTIEPKRPFNLLFSFGNGLMCTT